MDNPLLALQTQTPQIDIAGSFGRGQEVQTARLGNMLRSYQLQQEQRQDVRTNALAQLYQQHGPGLATGNPDDVNAVAQVDPVAAIGFRDKAVSSRVGQLDLAHKQIEFTGNVMSGVLNAPPAVRPILYQKALQTLKDNNVNAANLPPQYDEATISSMMKQSLSVKDQLANQLEQEKLAETGRHNVADEKTAQGNLGVARGNLGVAQGNLGVNQAKLNQEKLAPPAMIGFTGPDGEEVQKAAMFDKKSGRYIDSATMQPIINPQNLRVIGNATGGGRSMAMAGRVSTAALDAASDIENLSGIGTGAGMGLFANATTSPLSALSRTLTPQEVQDTQTTMAGLSRAMSLLGSGGMQGSDEVMKSFDRLNPNTGDSMLTTMRKLGSFRQQATNGIDSALESPMYSPAQKKQLQEAKDRMSAAIPWTPKDVQALENNGQSGTSMHDIYSAKLGKSGALATTTKSGATVSNWPGAH